MNDRPKSVHERIMAASGGATGDDSEIPAAGEIARPQGRRRLRHLAYALIGLALVGGGGYGIYNFPNLTGSLAQAAGKQNAASPQAESSAAKGDRTESTSDPFTAHAAQAGVKTCAALYAELGRALAGGTDFMVQSQTANVDADQHAMQGVVGMIYRSEKDYSGPAAGVVYAAPVGQTCEGVMVRVAPFPQNCEAVLSQLPKGSRAMDPLAGIPVYALGTGGEAMLMPAGQGCVAITIATSGK